jgi:hypothetical protein
LYRIRLPVHLLLQRTHGVPEALGPPQGRHRNIDERGRDQRRDAAVGQPRLRVLQVGELGQGTAMQGEQEILAADECPEVRA